MISQKELIELGFNKKEAKVYLAILELGPGTATEISRKAGINRTTSYDILESLASEGLVHLIGETKVQKYVAENPEKVISVLEKKIQKTQEQLKTAHVLLPQLLSIYSTKEKPKVKYFEGVGRMREGFEDTLTAEGEILAYAVGEDVFKAVGEKYMRDYFKRRTLKNISVRVIAPDTPESRAVAKNNIKELRTSLLVPSDKFCFSVEINIYNNKIMVASWREKFAIIIESEEIASAQKKIFELAWEGAKHINSINLN
ncbi:MAG: helix-turn-helix domain-containing protein [Patescibacteria group bacterium]|jgi:sugar-specific transcriptional regulator TrmB